MVVQSLVGGFKPWPVHEHRWLPPWVPVEELGLLDRVHALGGTPVVYLMGGVAKLARWPSGAPHAEAAVDLGAAEPFVRGASALASVVVEPGRGIAGLELIAYDAGTGLVRRLRDLGRGYEVVDEVDLGLTASKAALAVAGNGFTVLAVSNSPWQFFRIDQGIAEPISVPGSWTGGIALWPDLSSVRVVGTMSGGSRPLALAVAKLTDRLTASVTTIDGVPARDGMWFGRGMKDGRELLLVGGGRQGTNAHSDVFSVDVTRGGAVTSIANDDAAGAAAVGSDAWLDGTYDAAGWRLRAVPRGSRNPDERRAGSYERVGGRRDAGWQPAGRRSGERRARGGHAATRRPVRAPSCAPLEL